MRITTKLCISILSLQLLNAEVINIPADFSTIQAGIDTAAEGDTVLVAAGTYTENITWPATNGIKLIGEDRETTIIDGDSLASVIRFEQDLGGIIDTTTMISDFTITNGLADDSGGGIYCSSSDPSLVDVTITGNSANYGGGGISCSSSSPSLENVTISGNSASHYGGGIHCEISSPSLVDVTITGNSATGSYSKGGGIFCSSSSPSMVNVTLSNNSADSKGGGISCSYSSPSLENVTISNNSASDDGGGMYCDNSSPSLENVTISNNSASDYGGGVYCRNNSSPSLENATITGNSAYSGGGISCRYNSSPMMANVTITNNTASYEGGGISCLYNSSPNFSSENRCNIYSNNTTSRGSGADIYSYECDVINVIVDTFTVMIPTEYHASPLDNFTFDILNSIIPEEDQVNADLYVSPDGDNSNDGLTAESPLKTIQYATGIILADSTNPHTIHLANGVYSPSTNGEFFPVEVINYVSLVGESEDNVILDADSVASVIKCINATYSMVSNMTITGGSADWGGGIYYDGSSPSLANVTISNNSASYGGGIYCYYNSSPSLVDVTITGNSASRGGGIFCVAYSSPSLVDVTITGNSASDVGGGIHCYWYSSPSLVNCILWNDAPQEVYGSSVNIFYSDIQGGYSGEGNIDLDPLFTDTENGDYTLQENSPCIDTGTAFFVWENDTLVNMTEEEYYGTAPDMGAFESQYTVGIDPLSILPLTFSMNPAYPNPFNPSTTISYAVETNGRLSLQIYDIAGRLVETLVNGITEPGIYTVKWDASGYSSGVYFVQIQTKKFVKTQKLILLK